MKAYIIDLECIIKSTSLVSVQAFLKESRLEGKKLALISERNDTLSVAEVLKINTFFDVVLDANEVKNARPNPEIYLTVAEKLGVPTWECVAFVHSVSAMEAATLTQMKIISVGSAEEFPKNTENYSDFTAFSSIPFKLKKYQADKITQKEAVEKLLEQGFSQDEIKEHIALVYQPMDIQKIKSSFSYIYSIITLTIVSFLLGFAFSSGEDYVLFGILFGVVLLGLTFGVAKLNKICIYVWMSVLSFLILYMLISLFYKVNGDIRNELFSYRNIFSVLLFLSVTFRNLTSVLSKINQQRKEYKFN